MSIDSTKHQPYYSTEIRLSSWADFEGIAGRVLNDPRRDAFNPIYTRGPLFRGQSDASWMLETTLERHLKITQYPANQYLKTIKAAAQAVETVIGKRWEIIPEKNERPEGMPQAIFENYPKQWLAPEGYAFMAYLRQNGFPSPLLDWTRSPYIAAFFAFNGADFESKTDVAIFEYTQDTGNGVSYTGGRANVLNLGPWVATDKKHFIQQSEYTVCMNDVGHPHGLCYMSHESVFSEKDRTQDKIVKYLIEASQRDVFLDRLCLMNITEHSLFETVETLLAKLAQDLLGKTPRGLRLPTRFIAPPFGAAY